MIDHDLAKTRTALNVARRVRLAADGQTAMEEYEAKRSAAYENAERLRSLRHARDAAEAHAGEAVAKMPIRRKPRVESRLKRGA